MVNFTVIANPELVKLMQASFKFRALKPEKQEAHIQKIAALPPEKQAEIIAFFKKENAKESQERVEKLKKAYQELVELEAAFKKEMAKDRELKATQDDEARVNSMLNNI